MHTPHLWIWLQLKKHWKKINEVLNGGSFSGFGWDETQHLLTAEDRVWEAAIAVCLVCIPLSFILNAIHSQANPKLAWYRTHPFPLYHLVAEVASDSTATGEFAESSGDVSSQFMERSQALDEEQEAEAQGEADEARDQDEESSLQAHSEPSSQVRILIIK